MLLDQLLDITIDLLQHPEFKTFGALEKSRYQNNKTEEELFLRSDMYKGTTSIQKGSKHKPMSEEAKQKAIASRKAWYQNPENKAKFMSKLNKRDKKHRKNKEKAEK